MNGALFHYSPQNTLTTGGKPMLVDDIVAPESVVDAAQLVAIGRHIAARRRERRLSQEQLASVAGLSVRTVRNIEAARIARPRWNSLRLIAQVLELDETAWFESL